MSSCIYDSFSPCEHCNRCVKPKFRETIDEENNEMYHEISYDNGRTWCETD